jgi:hypothetical protein
VDDTIIFLDHDLEGMKNLKLLLCAFEQLSELKINFHKSEIFCFGMLKINFHEGPTPYHDFFVVLEAWSSADQR